MCEYYCLSTLHEVPPPSFLRGGHPDVLLMDSPFVNSLRVGRESDPILSSRAGLDGFRNKHMAKFRPLKFQAKFASRFGGQFPSLC